MAELTLSEAEKTFIVHGIQDDLRNDGRSCDDYRYMQLETGMLSNTNGSARLRLANTDVLVGIKAEISQPKVESPEQGRLEFFIDCTANATPQFEGRGGEELANRISALLIRAYNNSSCLSLESLCIINEQYCWVLYVDVLLLECGGNLYDAISIAIKAALFDLKLPVVQTSKTELGEIELELSDDPYDVTGVNVESAPTLVTLNKVGHCHIVDASMQEEACSIARLVVSVTPKGQVSSLFKEGFGSLNPDSVLLMIETAKKVGVTLNKVLYEKLEEEKKTQGTKQSVGFLN